MTSDVLRAISEAAQAHATAQATATTTHTRLKALVLDATALPTRSGGTAIKAAAEAAGVSRWTVHEWLKNARKDVEK